MEPTAGENKVPSSHIKTGIRQRRKPTGSYRYQVPGRRREYTADPDMDPVDEIISKLKKLVKSGNVDRIVVRRGDDVLLNIPVNVGLVGSVIGLAAAPWAVIAAAVAACLNGYCKKGEDIKVILRGGELIIRYTDEAVYMTGNCEKVFTGSIEI